MLTRQKSWVELAEEQVHISDVLSSLGVYVPESVRNGSNKKVHCPFGFYHSDGGLSKAMRVYGNSNTAYCFSCSKRYTVVTLAAAKWDCSWNSAALRLLEEVGFKPKTLKERWAEATMEEVKKPDLIALADALKTYCSGIFPNWAQDQLKDAIAEKLNKCLSLLNSVETEEEALKWLATCKIVMSKLLEK